MTRLSLRPHREQQLLPAACATTTPRTAPAVPLTPGRSAHVLFDLRAEDAIHAELAAARAALLVPLHRPASGLPALLAEAEHVTASRDAACRVLFAEDRVRREDIVAAAWIDAADGAQMAANAAAVVAAFAARPELRHDTALLMALAPVTAMLKGLVA